LDPTTGLRKLKPPGGGQGIGEAPLPPRHLEPVLQTLVRHGVLKGMRGPYDGYERTRKCRHITAHDILRAAGIIEDNNEPPLPGSALLTRVVLPAMKQAGQHFPRRSRASASRIWRGPPGR
jgi:hypothetical protein